VNVHRRHNDKTGHTVYILNINVRPTVAMVLLWLKYDGDGPWLPRKRETALKIIEISAENGLEPTVPT